MLASARDWAKLGVLYVNDGIVGGKKILHPDWVDFCAAATLGTDYAAGFYTNRSDHPDAQGRVLSGMPRDSFFASGILGQRIVIVPSHGLSWCGSAIPSNRPATSEAWRGWSRK